MSKPVVKALVIVARAVGILKNNLFKEEVTTLHSLGHSRASQCLREMFILKIRLETIIQLEQQQKPNIGCSDNCLIQNPLMIGNDDIFFSVLLQATQAQRIRTWWRGTSFTILQHTTDFAHCRYPLMAVQAHGWSAIPNSVNYTQKIKSMA